MTGEHFPHPGPCISGLNQRSGAQTFHSVFWKSQPQTCRQEGACRQAWGCRVFDLSTQGSWSRRFEERRRPNEQQTKRWSLSKSEEWESSLCREGAFEGECPRWGRRDGRRGSLFYKVLVSLPSLPPVLLRCLPYWPDGVGRWALGGPLLIGWTPLGEDSDCGHPVPRST